MRILPLSAVLFASFGLPAHAFELTGATATLDWRSTDLEPHQTHFTGGVELSFGSGISTQLSIKNTNYAASSDVGVRGHELHVIWRPQVEGLALGVFAGEEFFGPWFSYYGIEAKYEVANFSAEAAVLDYSGPGYDARHTTLELGYEFMDRFRVFGGMSSLNEDNSIFDDDITYVGASAKVAAGFSVFGKFSRIETASIHAYDSVTLGLRYDFGKGVTFQQRSYNELFPND